jgi:multicomponent Na+:H+ antiporter subunit B
MIERDDSAVVTTFVRFLVPAVQLFGLYVLAHGHESPGGGFQAGVILAAAYVALALGLGREALARRVHERACLALAAGGLMLYILTGVAGMLGGGTFLDYGALPLPLDVVDARHLGILVIETGIGITVAAAILLIFCRLVDREPGP